MIKGYVHQQHPDNSGEWKLDFHVYGKDQYDAAGPGELFVVAEALASTQQLANSVASKARVGMIVSTCFPPRFVQTLTYTKHAPYPGQKATAGNFGFGIGGLMEIEMGACAEFSLYHLMDLEPGEERLILDNEKPSSSKLQGPLLKGSVVTIGRGSPASSDDSFRQSISSLRDQLPKSTPKPLPGARHIPHTQPKQEPKTLSDLCRILRSKNAGPYEITIDAMFDSETDYQAIKSSGLLSPDNISKALDIPKEDIIWMGFFDPARAFKVTIPRVRSGKKKSAGGFMESDIHGSQEHLGLANLKLPDTNKSQLSASFDIQAWPNSTKLAVAIGSVGVLSMARRVLASMK